MCGRGNMNDRFCHKIAYYKRVVIFLWVDEPAGIHNGRTAAKNRSLRQISHKNHINW